MEGNINKKIIDVFDYASDIMKAMQKGVVVTAKADGQVNAMTISWGTLGREWEKKIFTIFIRETRFTHELLEKNPEFTVCIPVEGFDRKIVGICGTKSGRDIDKFALTNAVFNLDAAYKKFYRESAAGYPKFKSKCSHNYSYTTNFTNGNIEVDNDGNQIKLPKLKWVNAKVHRNFNGKIQSATIRQLPSGKYYVSVLVEDYEELPEKSMDGKCIGFDLGIKEFLVDSDGKHVVNPRLLHRYEMKLAKEQRKLAHKQKKSKNWEKQRIKVARLHEKIINIRENYLNQLSAQIISENQVIISEDLQISKMVSNNQLSKSIMDVSWGSFMRKLQYKAEWQGKVYHRIDPWYASSQICSCCGKKNEKVKLLSVRKWECECGANHHRDENAAQNILMQGKRELGIA